MTIDPSRHGVLGLGHGGRAMGWPITPSADLQPLRFCLAVYRLRMSLGGTLTGMNFPRMDRNRWTGWRMTPQAGASDQSD